MDSGNNRTENGLSGRMDLLDCAYALYFTEAEWFCYCGKLGYFQRCQSQPDERQSSGCYLSGIVPVCSMGSIKRYRSTEETYFFSRFYHVCYVSAVYRDDDCSTAITGADVRNIDWSIKTFMPTFDSKFFLNLSILVFAVGGCEKISPYVNKMKNPSKDFSKGMITLAIMVTVCAVLGTIALGMMFDSNNIPEDLMTNGAYYAFQTLGEYYHVGDFFVVVYAITNLIGQFAVLILSIDAPLRMLLDSADERYIPKALFKQNKYGTYTNGHKMVTVIVSILIVVPAFGIESVDVLVKWLVKVNSVCMPLRYLWVFAAYIALKKAGDKFHAEYRFVKNKTVGIVFGVWCFAFTAIACILGIYSEDTFQLVLNIVTPFVLIGLGFIMPVIAKRTNK